MSADSWDARSSLLLGEDAMNRLRNLRVTVVGCGGVGGYAVETLARCGVGHLRIIDADAVAPSNINRQIIALHSTIGKSKVELLADRCRDINPDIEVTPIQDFLTPDNIADMVGDADYIIDAIDTVAPKVALIKFAMLQKKKIISSMGAGGRIDPTKVGYYDLWETTEDGLARAVRQRLKKEGLRRPLRVVASTEKPRSYSLIPLEERNKRSSFGTIITIPAIFGMLLANRIVTDSI